MKKKQANKMLKVNLLYYYDPTISSVVEIIISILWYIFTIILDG